jgi:hypothetical protein
MYGQVFHSSSHISSLSTEPDQSHTRPRSFIFHTLHEANLSTGFRMLLRSSLAKRMNEAHAHFLSRTKQSTLSRSKACCWFCRCNGHVNTCSLSSQNEGLDPLSYYCCSAAQCACFCKSIFTCNALGNTYAVCSYIQYSIGARLIGTEKERANKAVNDEDKWKPPRVRTVEPVSLMLPRDGLIRFPGRHI